MSKNKTGKYFKYAIGEIILVVIGILIALQINNWNENRKERSNELKILNTLNAEFNRNGNTLDSLLLQLKRIEQSLSFVLQKIEPNPKINFTAIELDSILYNSFDNPVWKRSEYTLRNLESSGKLSALSNEDLRSKLYEWSLVAIDIEDKDTDASVGFQNLLNYYKENGSLRNLDVFGDYIPEGRSSLAYDHKKFFSDITFENMIDDYMVYTRQRIKRYQKAKVIINEIINLTLTEE
ncbi:DUF6090 family protein [Ichthyenterobacterium sp. W332]|uniref:DUF6090 family protein n=1 Tax=Microcosmobacter mediterraneus TaxID=3075607 RepID=A0ABU2YJ59_9FLAO|nr:DUF6090 family protein [Ichthyenterobacterium sp. W332]MDT0557835.1 DUF6090 family protein [Ichthyenterobacterium sp. W332]